MSIADKITKLQTDVNNAYSSIGNKGGTIPINKNTENLASAIDTITGGGSGTPIYTVTFDSNGGSAVASQQIVEGYTAKEPDAPTKDTYKLSHWELNGVEYDFETPVTSDITLIAIWRELYTQIEYIQSTGTQYIDTGVNGDAIGTFEIKFNPLSSHAHTYEQYFGGDIENNTTPRIFKYTGSGEDQNKVVAYWYNGQSYVREALFSAENKAHILKVTNADIYVDETKICSYEAGSWGSNNYYCFTTSDSTNIASAKLYYLKMYSDNVLVRDFIPVLDESNVACLFDKVSRTYFYNIGTGTFTAGQVL